MNLYEPRRLVLNGRRLHAMAAMILSRRKAAGRERPLLAGLCPMRTSAQRRPKPTVGSEQGGRKRASRQSANVDIRVTPYARFLHEVSHGLPSCPQLRLA